MIEGLKPYAEYKESGLPWIGELPTGGDDPRSKYLFREVFALKGQPHSCPGQSGAAVAAQRRPGLGEHQERQP